MREAINIFFESLSIRLRKENHLSDLLWALCETVPGLADNLWELCTQGAKCDQKPIVFREHPLIYDQRADFALFAGSELLLIENKIYDRNYHFRDYASAALAIVHVAKVRKCLITAHPLDQRSCHEAREHGWHVLPWSEVVEHLLRQDFEDLQPLIDAFVCYAREVCGMKEIQQIRLDEATLKGVFHLANLVEKLITQKMIAIDGCDVEYFNTSSRASGPGWIGHYYELKLPNDGGRACAFCGLSYDKEPTLQVALDTDRNRDLVKFLRTKRFADEYCQLQEGMGWNGVSFDLLPKRYAAFMNLSVEQQEQELAGFVRHVNRLLIEYLEVLGGPAN